MQQYKKILGKVMMTAEGTYNKDKKYEPISLVTDEETNKSYISRKEVPAGTQINNREYWQPVASSGIIDNGVIILNRKNSDGQIPIYDLKSATEVVSVGDRKGGVILGFLGFNPEIDTVPTWKLYQYNDVSPSNWTNIDYWLPMDYTNKYAGWFDNEKALYDSVPFPKVGMYAYVGNSVLSAIIYRCYKDRVWQPTEDKAFSGVVNLADEEDITSKQNKLKFKDKEYNPAQFSGLGKLYLRKNIVDGKNILTQTMMQATNTIYIIQYDYDLQGTEIAIPENSILDFQGGSLNNGIIDFNNSIIKNELNKAIFSDLKKIKNIHTVNVNWFKHNDNNITEFLKVVNIGDIVINFDSNYYTADISGLLLKNNTIIKGVNRDFSHINFNPNGDDYIIGLSAECKIFDIELKCLNASYEGDIVRMSNEFLKQNDIHNWEIRNVAINGQWEMTDVKSCGIAVICNEKDSKGDTNERVSLSYARMFENILIRPIRTGIRFEIIQETPNLPLSKKVWCNSFLFRNIEIWGHHGIYFNVSGVDGDTCRFTFDNYMFQGGHTEESTGFYCESYCPNVTLSSYNTWDCKNNGVINGGGLLYIQIDDIGNSEAYRDEFGNEFGVITKGGASVFAFTEKGQNKRLFFTKQYNGSTGVGVSTLEVQDETLKFTTDRFRGNSIELFNKYNSNFDAGFILKDLSKYPYIQGKFSGQPSCLINPLNNVEGTNLSRSVIYKSGVTGRGYVVESSWIPFDSENMKVFRLNYNIDYCVKRLNLSEDLKPNTLYRLILDVAYTSEENIGKLKCLSIFPIVESFYSDNSMGGLTIVKSNFVPSWKKIELWVKTYDTNVSTINLSFMLRSSLDTFNTTIVKDITLNSQDVVLYYTGIPKSYAQDKDGTVFNNTSTGTAVFSTSTNKPVWKTDEYWIYADGVREGTNYSGTFAQKPTESERGISIGFGYFCTDRKTSEGASNGIMIYYKGSNVWVDALGRIVE